MSFPLAESVHLAATGKPLGVPGEHLPGNHTAPEVVGWYNAHPDTTPTRTCPPTQSGLMDERAVVVGTGNVALVIARIFSIKADELARTDMADHALVTLRTSSVREVVLLDRRGPEHAAISAPELLALREFAGVELVVDDCDPRTGKTVDAAPRGNQQKLLRGVRRAVFDYSASPQPNDASSCDSTAPWNACSASTWQRASACSMAPTSWPARS